MEMKREPILGVIPLAVNFGPDVDLLEMANELVEEIESGKVTAVAIVAVKANGETYTGWLCTDGKPQCSGLVTGTARLAYRLQAEA